MSELRGKKVLVTGATGFIGGRLAERLATEAGASVTGTGRNLSKVPFLREAGVNLQSVDLLDEAGMAQVVAGQDVVFHVAAWLGSHGQWQQAEAYNVQATVALVRLAAAHRVKRFVHTSSIAVYGIPTQPVITEETPFNDQTDRYGRTKAEGERQALALAQQLGLELTVIRPGMVYGPRALGWSVRMLQLVQKRVPVIYDGGRGHAYPIYIDNLIDGMILAATQPGAVGEAFNFCDAPVTFKEWFGYYGRMCGREPKSMPLFLARLIVTINDLFNLHLPLTRERLNYFLVQSNFPTTKAQQRLGYQPRIPIDEGMRRTEAWLRQEGYLGKGHS